MTLLLKVVEDKVGITVGSEKSGESAARCRGDLGSLLVIFMIFTLYITIKQIGGARYTQSWFFLPASRVENLAAEHW